MSSNTTMFLRVTNDILSSDDIGPSDIPDTKLPGFYFDIMTIIIVLIMIISLTGNTLALFSIMRNKKSLYPLFFNLALSDLLKTVFCMPYSIYLLNSPWIEDTDSFSSKVFGCQFFGFWFHLTLIMGLVANMCVALDRVHATYFPFHYANSMISWPARNTIMVSWAAVTAISSIPFIIQYAGVSNNREKAQFRLENLVPMCLFDIRDVYEIRNTTPTIHYTVVGIYYFLLYGAPIIVLTISTCLVITKLLPRLKMEQRLNKNSNLAVIYSNSVAATEVTFNVTEVNVTDPDAEQREPRRITTMVDRLLKLHRSKHAKVQSFSTRNNQWRAVKTMIIVSVSFILCHVTHFIFWMCYDFLIRPFVDNSIIKSERNLWVATLKTTQIVFVYLDAVVNVAVYYSRCKLMKEQMKEYASRLLELPCIAVRRINARRSKNL